MPQPQRGIWNKFRSFYKKYLSMFLKFGIIYSMKLVIASGNKHKIKEIKTILAPYFDYIVSAAEAGFFEDVAENGNTFKENAEIKAKAVSNALNCACIADDSGLCVDALNGKPGVFSARYSGSHGNDLSNNLKLLKEMEGVKNRNCRFMCSVVLTYPDGKMLSGEGSCEGVLLHDFQGLNGFGYDSLFFSLELKKSFGEACEEEKNALSHRYRAIVDLVKKL